MRLRIGIGMARMSTLCHKRSSHASYMIYVNALVGELCCFVRMVRDGSASIRASQGRIERTAAKCKSHGATSQSEIQNSRFKKIGNARSRTEVENRNPKMETRKHVSPVTNRQSTIPGRGLLEPHGMAGFQVTQAIGNAWMAVYVR